MAERSSFESLPGKLAEYLAELVIQLRHSSTLPDYSGTTPSSLPKLHVLAQILEGMGTKSPDLLKLGQAMVMLSNQLAEVPSSGGSALAPSLRRLVEFLESFLEGLDKGDNLELWLEQPYWSTLQRSFRNAQTSLAVFDDLDDVIRNYQHQQKQSAVVRASSEAMSRRWSEVRRQGDLVFSASDTNANTLDGFCVILLLDGEISRHFLRERLVGGGAEVIVADSPVSALEISRCYDVSPTILCDQVAPGNHLSGLRLSMEQSAPFTQIPLILVTMGDNNGQQSNLERARKLGACGIWRDPYDLRDLLPCILQGKLNN